MTNKDAISRYLIIDELLRSPKLRTLDEIIAMVSDRMGRSISKRTIQLDIQEMRHNSILDFRAPIQVNRVGVTGKMAGSRAYYTYSDKNYPIHTKLTHLNMTIIEIPNQKLANAIMVVVEEVELQDAVINVSRKNYSSFTDLRFKMVELSDELDEFDGGTVSKDHMIEVLKELSAQTLRELSKYSKEELGITS